MAREFKPVDVQTTLTYDIGDGFMVDIIDRVAGSPEREAWIYHTDYGIKTQVFGSDNPELIEKFMDILGANIEKFVSEYSAEYLNA